MRLFIAIELDNAARAAIASLQTRLKAALGDERSALKWIRPEHMHLTLAFLGELEDGPARSMVEAMGRPVPADRFAIVFGGLGMFPSAGAPRVLWLGVAAGASEVAVVQREVAARVTRRGITLERRPFHPHLTLARWRTSRPSDRRQVVPADWADEVARIEVHQVSLIHSRLSRDGPTYASLAEGSLSRGRLGDSTGPPLQSA
jgi:RNA 2',3'-cyclic 3'-phosphodiesterase